MRETRFWIDRNSKFKSALKVVASYNSFEMFLYNSKFPKGKRVEGSNFYKMSIGRNTDYDLVSESEFLNYIKDLK